MAQASLADEMATVRALCRELGLGAVRPELIKAAHHTTLLLPPLSLVARVQSAEPLDEAWSRAAREIDVARFLGEHGAPAITPPRDYPPGPHRTPKEIVTLWPYVEHARGAGEADAPLAATMLVAIHRHLAAYAGTLPSYTQALDRCWTTLDKSLPSNGLCRDDRDLLRDRFRRLRATVETIDAVWQPLHGDAHPGNLLLCPQGALWTDFEDACLGPREYDIACLPRETWPQFEQADPSLLQQFDQLRSLCVVIWCLADLSRGPEIREAADYHLGRVRRAAAGDHG